MSETLSIETSRVTELAQIRRLEVVSIAEATTLVLLVVLAVPLKHLGGWELGVRLMGPIHGLAFVAYIWTALQTVAGSSWSWLEATRLFLAAFVPFGGFLNLPLLSRRARRLQSSLAPS
jgi:integral membrane protein